MFITREIRHWDAHTAGYSLLSCTTTDELPCLVHWRVISMAGFQCVLQFIPHIHKR